MKRIPISAHSHRARTALMRKVGPLVAFSSFDMSRSVYFCPVHLLDKALCIKGVSTCRIKGKLFAAWGQDRANRCGRVARAITAKEAAL